MSSELPPHGPRIDDAATRAVGGSILPASESNGAVTGISVGGWEIRTQKGAIAGERDCDELRAAVGGAPALPEQLYASSSVEATHLATGVRISFSAKGALQEWMRTQGKGGGEGSSGEAATATVARPKVPAAERWRASRAREIAEHSAPELEYDWTFTCPYGGDIEVRRNEGEEGDEAAAAATEPAGEEEEEPAKKKRNPTWLQTPDRLDRAALSARDPLLLWDEVLLLASELDDCGISEVTVRIRAMPRRWYAVSRCFVRVDGVCVRLLESRVVATFRGQNDSEEIDVLRETTHSGGDFAALVAAGAPGPAAGSGERILGAAGGDRGGGGGGGQGPYSDADAASQALSAVAPVGVTRFVTERLVLAP